jgi:large subunit ribosomal protein L17
MVTAIILTEREVTEFDPNPPKVPGRIITTLEKAKEIRPLVEKCITIAKKGLLADQKAVEFATTAEKGSEEWKKWRASEQWQKWAAARSPGVMARRKIFSIVKDRDAVKILFDRIAPRFTDRPGGYTRIMRLATPRLGDNGTRAILEFVGKNDRVVVKATKPAFGEAAPVAE